MDPDTSGATRTHPIYVKIRNDDAAISVFAGGSDVSTTNGYEIEADTKEDFILGPDDDLWLVAASGTPTVHIFQTGS